MRKLLAAATLTALYLASPTSFAKETDREYRPLSDKGKEIVASRAFKGRKIVGQMLERVDAVDKGYRNHIELYGTMKSCKASETKITTMTPDSKIDSTYTLKPMRKAKGDGAPDSCEFTMQTVTSATEWTVTCSLSMKEANVIADEAISSFSDAIDRFRKDGLYSNISPSKTLTQLQQSESCKMAISASSFE